MGKLKELTVGVQQRLEPYRGHTSKFPRTSSTTLRNIRDGRMGYTLSLLSLPMKVRRTRANSGP
eukprot:11260935-Heterocapsa_arctica.AAC.1